MARKVYKEVRESVGRIESDDFEGSIGDVIDMLTKLRDETLDAGYEDIVLESNSYSMDCGSPTDFDIIATRMETDAERDKRLADARKVREEKKQKRLDRIEKEKETLAHLIKKHGIPSEGEI